MDFKDTSGIKNCNSSSDIETTIHKHASSLFDLSQTRIMMEVDYMLSYGAAESSICLLHKYHIFEILLPFQASYIYRQPSGSEQRSDDVSRAARQKHEPDMSTGPSPAGLASAGTPRSGRHRRKARARQPGPAQQA
uniref:tRNA nucleotidyltransferase/poly(A) polymerase RNA and SrmB- binding domain-containing protein n=1 Tax=Lactuca sativa TaxID=4236 RepID=A0A9R1WLQ1_LACSA|nr:hypothetical protein LSAT_V11C100011130 [Lactuca sativa]